MTIDEAIARANRFEKLATDLGARAADLDRERKMLRETIVTAIEFLKSKL